MRLSLLLPILPLAVAVACVTPARIARPADFPAHASDRFFDFHWRLVRGAGRVVAIGLVEATRVDGIAGVTLELRGLDREGRVVSRALGRTYGGWLSRWNDRPFAVSLHPSGREERFDVRVWSYTWEGGGHHSSARSGGL